MNHKSGFELMARYNKWMNERIYEVCVSLTDAERKEDRGAFFHSIHGTLNHLLLGDQIWLGRFKNRPLQVERLDQGLFSDFDELRSERRRTDDEILDWSASLTDRGLAELFEFTSFVKAARWRCPLWVAVRHFFNHQTHHRGPLTTLLSQCGKDVGVTDLMWLPGLLQDAT